jgi:hypothetical protein
MGKRFNAIYMAKRGTRAGRRRTRIPPEEDWEAGFSDWKHNKDDDLATAVRRYALPMRRVRIWDEVEVGR